MTTTRSGAFDDASPEAAVRSWWRAWAEGDAEAIALLAREDYLEFTGHTDRHRVGRRGLLEAAARTFELFTVEGWELSAVQQLLPSDDVALVGYRWEMSVRRGDGVVRRSGAASDLLVRSEEGWRYLSHHSSTLREEAG